MFILSGSTGSTSFLILEGGLLVILIDCMIFLSPFLDVTRMSVSTVSFLAQVDWSSLPIEFYFKKKETLWPLFMDGV